MSSAAQVSAISKPRPYRRYLTSELHSRFIHATLQAFLIGLIFSFYTGKDYFWSWFPLGPAGLKAALFSMCSLFIFILQVATLTVGRRTSPSPFAHVRRLVFELSTYQTFIWYIISAWWFCEAYIWSVPEYKELGWVTRESTSTLDRLNERPIYLRFFFTVLAIVQSCIHLYYDQSALHIAVTHAATPQANDHRTHVVDSTWIQLQRKLSGVLKHALLSSSIASILAPFIYKAFFRNMFWRVHLAFAKPFFSLSRSDANLPDSYFIGTILGSAFLTGLFLSTAWEISAHNFLVYIKKEPVKNGLPLSAASKTPNGTLLNGLAVKRDVVKTFAFWELAIIAQKDSDRRKAIFADFEQPNGPMWTSMHKAALEVVRDIDNRILALIPTQPQQPQPSQQVTTLPRIAKNPRQDPIAASSPSPVTLTQSLGTFMASTGKIIGQSHDPWHPPLDEVKQQLIEYASSQLEDNKDLMTSWFNTIYTDSVRGFFRVKPSNKIASVVLGTPVGNAAIIVDAIESVTRMLIASLNEDGYGKAVQTVPGTVNQFARTITLIESLVSKQIEVPSTEDKAQLQEVVIIVGRLKSGLRELLSAFQVFLNDVGLAIKDLNEAKKASEERPLLPPAKKQPVQSETTKAVEEPQRRQLGSRAQERAPEDNRKAKRAEEQQPKRLESSSRKSQNGNGNVFGARDFHSQPVRRREMEQVR